MGVGTAKYGGWATLPFGNRRKVKRRIFPLHGRHSEEASDGWPFGTENRDKGSEWRGFAMGRGRDFDAEETHKHSDPLL